ncbi:ABC transporter permease [Methanocella sp. MCL-LM]|uniref:ABC transporter permease n=1 Tax=Methanocella sp. MCL-LM TaxID=3412035 RepID=UPI003C7352C1
MNIITAGVPVYKLAKLEFIRVLTHPLTLIIGVFVLVIAFLCGAGGAVNLSKFEAWGTHPEDVFFIGFGNSLAAISMICMVMAIFLSVTAIPSERWKSSLNVLLTKPVYRRDFVLGKFAGLSVFMFLFNTFTILATGLMLIIFFREPASGLEFGWRLIAYILVLSLSCSIVIALNMLFSLISRNILFVTAISVIYVFFDWIWYNDRLLGTGILSLISPMNLYYKFIKPFGGDSYAALFNTTITMGQWLDAVLPYLVILLIEIAALLLIEIYLFSREDTT